MSEIPGLSYTATNNEDEEHDGESFINIPRTIPSTNTNYNNAYLKRSDATDKNGGGDAKVSETAWGANRSHIFNFEPSTPPAQSVREFAKTHPEQFYSTIEDEDEEKDGNEQTGEDRQNVQGEMREDIQDNYYNDHDDEADDADDAENDDEFDSFAESKGDSEIHGTDHYGKLETHPKTDNQDTLWTEIDALDDVKNLAQTIDLYEGFPLGFEDQLQKIRESHAQVLRAMRDRNARIEEEKRHEITSKSDSQNSGGLPNANANTSMSRVASNATGKPDRNIKHDTSGPTVLPDEDKYIQEMIDSIKALRTS
ncbi:hypothetical protein HG535_0A05660 [Zygotorulaspora mrakii]|uniref:Uncharacterized protein n=1 Tax=Zygotorulaspora mrakii TaxID=42260 RepID=A0A7H9AWA9_ZYGMR|nr:uncharacterized protein HG535_0A05660 [Zygotorulaspora mrakii]QLG70625.1 hypothetical protein HG535_0A05660 [Zygotorulaspora mrakii]